jgi:hypothetical protein
MINQVLVLFQKSGMEFVQAARILDVITRSSEHDFTMKEIKVQETIMVMAPIQHQ